jgi:hypothetical protein
MKTLLRLLVVGLVVNGCFQASRAAWSHYQLTDAVEQAARFGDHKTTSELRRRLVALGQESGVSLESSDVTVEKRRDQTRVALAYVQSIPLVPSLYTHQRTAAIDMTVTSVHPLTVDDRPF